MKRVLPLSLALTLTLPGLPAVAADHLVSLKGRAFVPETLKVKTGDGVVFRNDDPIEHAVSSGSPARTFEIDPLRPGDSRRVEFTTAGRVEVECGRHGGMHLVIEVGG